MRFLSPAAGLLALAAVIHSPLNASAWEPKQAPLMTDWAKQVDPANPLPEYPRPQLVRNEWLNLNGVWQFQAGAVADAVPVNQKLSGEILVPFPMESALSGVKQYHDRSWYRRTFTVPEKWSGQHIVLHLDAVDWESEVFINGKSVGLHTGGYDPASYDITPYLNGKGSQELIVRVYDPTDNAGEPRGKQTLHPHGIMYTSTSGIWQPVWLEPVPVTGISDLKMVPDIDAGVLKLTVSVPGASADVKVKATARIGKKVVGKITGAPGAELLLPVPKANLWSPTNPFLYDLDVTVTKGSKVEDTVTSYFGMRKISLGKVDGFTKILLNNQFVFEMGPLDQGFWPDGIYTAPTDDALKSDIQREKAVGFNMVRKHIKVERARWYYWADKLGILVWQDMPSYNSYTDRPAAPDVPEFKSELERIVQTHWNAPSIIMWVIFNEAQGQHDTAALVHEVKDMDPSRLVNQASGGDHFGVGDILDVHAYPDPNYPVSQTQAVVCGEYGGVGLAITNHTWASGWGYVGAKDGVDLVSKFNGFSELLSDFVQNHGLSAAVYTEITDVETELNGLYTYDRKVRKPDLHAIQAAIAAPLGKYALNTVLPTSRTDGQTWRYTTIMPSASWYTTNYSDASWAVGLGGFGTAGTPGAVVRTVWNTSDIWLRRTFNPGALTPEQISHLAFSLHHDEDVEVYLNGVPVLSASGFIGNYMRVPFSAAARNALLIGQDNVLAVHCHQTIGGQYVDVGIDERTVLAAPPAPSPAQDDFELPHTE
ncbi:MAG TPA: glycoside hydrolase family 2 TIM barrel-domain containing protein [Verrucomicrobiae bacterium]|nr:glycoside hydrolase family 2 TIM barrel-domain containing protein [Verrucomicrobiae bacterium]